MIKRVQIPNKPLRQVATYISSFIDDDKSEFVRIATGEVSMNKYEFKKEYMVIYLCLMVVSAFFMISRWINRINPELKLLPDFILLHITNFALCMMVLLIFGFVVLCFGGKLIVVTIAAILITVLGIVYECFLPFLNTPDMWDAGFVVAGTVVAYFYLVMLKRNGLIEK